MGEKPTETVISIHSINNSIMFCLTGLSFLKINVSTPVEMRSQKLQNFILNLKVDGPPHREIIFVNDISVELISNVIFSSSFLSFSRINLRIVIN